MSNRINALDGAIAELREAPKVNIKGKQYSQVSTRVEVFRKHFGVDFSLLTELVELTDERVVVKATVATIDGQPIATGLAEEMRGSSAVNKTSALENCETSAVGRALAAFGLHGGEYATADEVVNAIAQQQNGNGKPATTTDGNGTWTGPLARTAFKNKIGDFAADIAACADSGQLEALLSEPSTEALIEQCKVDKPAWWEGDADITGLFEKINMKREDFRLAAEFDDGQRDEAAA